MLNVEMNLRILNAVDRITCHKRKETLYSKNELDLGGFDQSQMKPIARVTNLSDTDKDTSRHLRLVSADITVLYCVEPEEKSFWEVGGQMYFDWVRQ